jgi:hypothetical protein
MTIEQLTELFNKTFGLSPWPETYEVDHQTYANVCQAIFKNKGERVFDINIYRDGTRFIEVAIGSHGGIKFKNVELILKSK